MELNPFTVSAEEDSGYRASNTLSGTRINTSLRDIGASIRNPAHFNGVYGHKPTFGLVSRRFEWQADAFAAADLSLAQCPVPSAQCPITDEAAGATTSASSTSTGEISPVDSPAKQRPKLAPGAKTIIDYARLGGAAGYAIAQERQNSSARR